MVRMRSRRSVEKLAAGLYLLCVAGQFFTYLRARTNVHTGFLPNPPTADPSAALVEHGRSYAVRPVWFLDTYRLERLSLIPLAALAGVQAYDRKRAGYKGFLWIRKP